MTEFRFEAPIFNTGIGEKVRVGINFGSIWTPLLWFQVSRNGSLYLGPRYLEVGEVVAGKAKRQPGGQVRIDYRDGSVLDTRHYGKGTPKLSFHPHQLNAPGAHGLRGPDLSSLSGNATLCWLLFESPEAFAPDSVGPRDVRLDYPLDPNCPIMAAVYASPLKAIPVKWHRQATHQVNLVFAYKEVTTIDPFALQVVLWHGPSGEWPPRTYLYYSFEKRV